jgi:hypothetical protein
MAVASPNKQNDRVPEPPEGDELPYAPPEEGFWHRFSWHGEFPISILASIAIVVAIGLLLIYLLKLQFNEKKAEERPPVPTRGLKIAQGERGGRVGGPGGGQPKEVQDARPVEPQRQIPAAELKRETISASTWVPDLKNNPEALERIVQSPGYDRLNKLNDELKQRAGKGFGGEGGSNNGSGTGSKEGPGIGDKKGPGDATTSGSRSVRWTILFRTNSGKDYLEQLAEFKAKIVIPEPPGWKTNLLFTDVANSPKGVPLTSADELPMMQFVDEDRVSASKIARALGLEFDPPYFAAYFTKEVEEELAAKERAYKGLKEHQIYSTTFRVEKQANGKYAISVTNQVANRK